MEREGEEKRGVPQAQGGRGEVSVSEKRVRLKVETLFVDSGGSIVSAGTFSEGYF